jgi:hypothetical protein
MRKIGMTVAVAALVMGPLLAAPQALAGQVGPPSPDPVVVTHPGAPVQMFDCVGGTGRMGCGPGWFWRDGWRGMGCYPC